MFEPTFASVMRTIQVAVASDAEELTFLAEGGCATEAIHPQGRAVRKLYDEVRPALRVLTPPVALVLLIAGTVLLTQSGFMVSPRVVNAAMSTGSLYVVPDEDLSAIAADAAAQAKQYQEQQKNLRAKVAALVDGAQADQKAAFQQISSAQGHRDQAKELRVTALSTLQTAKDYDEKAAKDMVSGEAAQAEAREKVEQAANLMREGKAKEAKGTDSLQAAKQAEEDALEEVGFFRVCVELPGVRLNGKKPTEVKPIATSDRHDTWDLCMQWCQSHEECRQAVFTGDTNRCEFFGEATSEPIVWESNFNSTYCGALAEKYDLMDKLEAVIQTNPRAAGVSVDALHVHAAQCAWEGENCLQSRCCADTCAPNATSAKCEPYTCYKRDQDFAGCKSGAAPADWIGTKLGGHQNKDVRKAKSASERQGTSLFCFTVLKWSSFEGALALNFKSKGLGICACNEHAFIDRLMPASSSNVDGFIQAWEKVKQDGRWEHHDWTVKVDSDAVFFPERLRWHLKRLRTPRASFVYLRNTGSEPHLLGVLSVLTTQAVRLYFERSQDCKKHILSMFGEDFWLLSCLEGLGVGYQSDYHLLDDQAKAIENCTSDRVVAFPMNRKVDEWNTCHKAAAASWENRKKRHMSRFQLQQ